MTVLCTGSVAIDHIMVFEGRFRDVILPDKIHMLNVAFHVPKLNRSYGGTAANIAFNLRRLGGEPIILGTVGGDFGAYEDWLRRHDLRTDHILRLEDESTPGAYITTDLDDNQILGFHAGAMDRAHEAKLAGVTEPIDLGIVSPNGKQAMIDHARGLKERGVATVIDPGQGLPLFDRDELIELLDGADVYIVNDYEWELTQQTTGEGLPEIAARVGALIVTKGAQGSTLYRGDEREEIPVASADTIVDPTGCGDAYRAGLLHGMGKGLPLEQAARIGSVMGALLVERHGTQSLELDLAGIRERHRRAFGSDFT